MAALRSTSLATVCRRAVASRSSALGATQVFVPAAAPCCSNSLRGSRRAYSTENAEASGSGEKAAPKSEGNGKGKEELDEAAQKTKELLEQKDKTIAELKDARLRSLADYENLQKITTREKQQAKDFALTSFARDLISSMDILSLALKSVAPEKLSPDNKELVELHTGVKLTRAEIEKVLKRHGVIGFDPTGEQFDPNKHEALYQAPVPGKEPGSVLECSEIGYMIKDRLLRPAKVGVVLASE